MPLELYFIMILTGFFVNSGLITSKSCITFATDLYSIKLLTFLAFNAPLAAYFLIIVTEALPIVV
jgi:hypothetical protein